MRKKGFTLAEIMMVTAVISLLATIAMPNFVKARETSQRNVCIANLKQIQNTIQAWTADNNKSESKAVTLDDLVPDCIKKRPACPKGGAYTLTTVDKEAVCSLSNSPDNHHL